jgi:uncharacterized protein (DUF302 family)
MVFIAAVLLGAAILLGQSSPMPKADEGGNPMLYSVVTDKPLARLREDLPKSCADHKFGVLSVIDLKERMREKGVEYAGECLIFEVCNPQKAKTALEASPEISTMLPCRITAFKGKDGRTQLATIRPTRLLDLFGSSELRQLAAEVENTVTAIMNEAAR